MAVKKKDEDGVIEIQKIEVNRGRFVEALKYTRECAKNNIISLFDNICLKPDRILAFNGIQGMMIKLNTQLSCLLKPELLYKIINSYDTDLVVIEKGEDKIKVDNTTVKCVPENSYQFDINDSVTSKFVGSIPLSEEVMEGIEKCMSIVNTNELAEAKLGVSIVKGKEGISFNSVDDLRLARYEILDFTSLPDAKVDIVLPYNFCKLLSTIYKGQENKENCELHYSKEDFVVASFDSGRIMLYTKVNKGLKLLPFEKEFNKIINETTPFTEIPKELFASITRTNITAPKENITLLYKDKNLTIKTKNESCMFEEVVNIDLGKTSGFAFRTNSSSLREVFKFGSDLYYNEKENVLVLKNDDLCIIVGNTD